MRQSTTRGESPDPSAGRGITDQQVKERITKLDGEFKSLRTQFRMFTQRHGGGQPQEIPPDVQAALRNVSTLSSELNSLKAQLQQADISRLPSELSSLKGQLQQVLKEQQSLKAKVASEVSEADLAAVQQENASLKTKLQEFLTKQAQQNQEFQRLQQTLAKLSQEGKTPSLDVERLKVATTTTSSELASFKREIYNSGVLLPKIDLPPSEEGHPPVGTLTLGQDIFTARLLLKLGFLSAAAEQRKELAAQNGYIQSECSEFDSDLEDDEMDECALDWVSGLKSPEVQPGDIGHFAVTKGWNAVCMFTHVLQVLALTCIFMYGLSHGDQCVDEAPTGSQWWTLHLSKAAGVIVVGALMGGDVMDTVNFLMVSALLEKSWSLGVVSSATLRIAAVGLAAIANGVLFIVQTNPEGVWLCVTAMGFVNELGRAVLNIARHGVMGVHISKAVSNLNFQLCFARHYPWWFQPLRRTVILLLFGFIGCFAFWCFCVPMQECPKHGKARNIFLDPWWMR